MADNPNEKNNSSFLSDSEVSRLSDDELNFFADIMKDIPKSEPEAEPETQPQEVRAASFNEEDLMLLRSMQKQSKETAENKTDDTTADINDDEKALFAAVNANAKRRAEAAKPQEETKYVVEPAPNQNSEVPADEVGLGKTITVDAVKSEKPASAELAATVNFVKSDEKPEKASKNKKADKSEKKKRPWWQKILLGIWSVFKMIFWYLCIAVGAVIAGVIIFFMCVNQFEDPELDSLFANRQLDQTTTIYAKKSGSEEYEVIAELYLDENREWVNYEDMPEVLIDALVSIEDERFWEHNGVDWKRTIGAVAKYVAGVDNYGGSTITQQLIKNITGDDDYSWQRKAKEILRALYIEKRYDKEEILEYYLNTVYFNYRAYGVGKACELYYNKSVTEINAAEAAALVAIIQMPSAWEPYYHPDANTERKETVLGKMYELGYLDEAEYEEALNYHIRYNPNGMDMQYESNNSYYVDQVISDVVADISETLNMEEDDAELYLYRSGLQIYSCMDQDVQDALDHCYIEDQSWWPEADIEEDYQSAFYIMNYTTGEVYGIAGGRGEKTNRGLNRATQSPRQTGSAIKPLSVYAPGIEEETITMGSVVDDVPLAWMGDTAYPRNVSGEYYGKTTMYKAIRQSLNATPAQILQTLSYQTAYDYLTEKLHFQYLTEDDINVGAMAMGGMTYGATVAEMTAGYAAIANGGVYTEPITYTRVEYADGRTLIDKTPETNRAFSEQTAWLMQYLLVDGVNNGFAAIDLGMPVAGKTGTTDSGVDKWYMCYTPYFAAGVWVGYDENNISLDSAGVLSTISRYVAKHVLDEVIAAKGWADGELQSMPDGIVQASYCLDCGGAPTANCALDPRGDRIGTAYYKEGTTPSACTCHTPVYLCTESGMVAHNGCPSAELKCLVLTERAFTKSVTIPDANYMWMNIPDGTALSFEGVAFQNVLGAGINVGTAEGVQVNHLCTTHTVPEGQEAQLYNPNNVIQITEPTDPADPTDPSDPTEPSEEVTCTITLGSHSHSTVSFSNSVEVAYQSGYSFTVTPDTGYTIFSVTAGPSTLTAASIDGDGTATYSIDSVTDNIVVTVRARKSQ